MIHDSSASPCPTSSRNRRQFSERKASAALGGFVHQVLSTLTPTMRSLKARSRHREPAVIGLVNPNANLIAHVLIDAGVASACAPTYFDHWRIEGIDGFCRCCSASGCCSGAAGTFWGGF